MIINMKLGSERIFDVLIIGSGPSGLTAAIYCARAAKSVAVLTGPVIGGQLTTTTHVENYPGFADPIMGPQLMQAMYAQAEKMDAKMFVTAAEKVEQITNESVNAEFGLECSECENLFKVSTYDECFLAKSVIIATGANAKWLGNEGELVGAGVSSCATCDGAFFRNQEIAVIGGGNSALEEALYLANIASKVYLIHRKEEFKAEAIMQKRLFENKKIEILWPFVVEEFVGKNQLESLNLRNVKDGSLKNLQVSGAFVAIGHSPNTKFLNGLLDLDESGYIKDGVQTKIPGLFVAGDVFDSKYRQAVTAAGFGCMAALECLKYLE